MLRKTLEDAEEEVCFLSIVTLTHLVRYRVVVGIIRVILIKPVLMTDSFDGGAPTLQLVN